MISEVVAEEASVKMVEVAGEVLQDMQRSDLETDGEGGSEVARGCEGGQVGNAS